MDLPLKNCVCINFKRIPPLLKVLVSKVPDKSQFRKKHGYLLGLVSAGFDEDMMRVMFHFFDPLHHCFTFPDYQLVPTLEEFSRILGIPILDQVPFTGLEVTPKSERIAAALQLRKSDITWVKRSGVEGLLPESLYKKAQLFLDAMSYHAFEEILALLIYGLVLFPNPDNFIDVRAINIFLTRNPVPTLLGDILHSLHTRTTKERGTLMCCIPLLSKWFISHLPQTVLKPEWGCPWSKRMMSLSNSDILWGPRTREGITYIDHYGQFPNVPLLGIRGGITYNPSLALRQFGYARNDGPHDNLIKGIVFNYENDPQDNRQKFKQAWNKVYRVNTETWGPKKYIPGELYLRWVRTRAQRLTMPYRAVRPVIIEPENEEDVPLVILHPDMPTNLEEL
ncbi:uncharacterized protein LOC131630326 [Vicia villosa]|uniref:uncharacterized protein LOC131630326 n=1 Tax=Vicia villosa TaxID=3911 RepID=UPI00273AAAD4|nr:uncharacterized protein LOC131630326 [Vicia villosa]